MKVQKKLKEEFTVDEMMDFEFEVVQKFSDDVKYAAREIILFTTLNMDKKEIKRNFYIIDEKELEYYEKEYFTRNLCGAYWDILHVPTVVISHFAIEFFAEKYFKKTKHILQFVTFGILVHEITHYYYDGHEKEFFEKALEIYEKFLPKFQEHFGKVSEKEKQIIWERIIGFKKYLK